MKKQIISVIIAGTITSQVFIPSVIALANEKKQYKNNQWELGNGIDNKMSLETIATLDYDNITKREGDYNLYFDVKVPNANSNTRIEYKFDGETDYKYIKLSNEAATITVPKSTNSKNIDIRLGEYFISKDVTQNLNNGVILPLNIGPEVIIPDPNLKKALNHAIDPRRAADSTIYKTEAKGLKKLTLTDNLSVEKLNRINNLEGIQYFVNLENIDITSSRGTGNISNISQLASLKNLKSLKIYNAKINDLSPLRNLVNLSSLDLSRNNISDLSQLSNLVNLSNLNVNRNNISDLKPLSKLINLKHLYLAANKILDLKPLVNLVNLNILEIHKQSIDAGEVTTDRSKVSVKNIVKDLNGDLIPAMEDLVYDYVDGNVIFKNIYDSGRRVYYFEKSIQIGAVNSTFSGGVSQNIIREEKNNEAVSKLAYFRSYGIIIEGSLPYEEKYDDTVKKSLVIRDKKGNVKLKKDVLNTDWYERGNYSGFQAIVTTEDISNIGEVEDGKLEIEVNKKGTIRNYEFKTSIISGDGSGGPTGSKPTPPNVDPTLTPGTDMGWASDYYYIQDLPKVEFGSNTVQIVAGHGNVVYLTNKVKDFSFDIMSYYKTDKEEYTLDTIVKIKNFDMHDAKNTFEVKDKDGDVVYIGDVATFTEGTFKNAKPRSALQVVVPQIFSNDNYRFELVVKDKSGVKKARFKTPKFF